MIDNFVLKLWGTFVYIGVPLCSWYVLKTDKNKEILIRMIRSISKRIRLPDSRECHVELGGNADAAKTLVFLPGALGSLATDFAPQFAPESILAQEYKLVCFEPAGYGRSR